MISQQDPAATQPLTVQDRRAFLQLPLEERRRRLAEQADRIAEIYQQPANEKERTEWQGGDIVE
ncbi:MAG TPA: hypothetical protein VGI40_08545 [Pirellulaceae bacterium]|jgi:hypothetical protein